MFMFTKEKIRALRKALKLNTTEFAMLFGKTAKDTEVKLGLDFLKEARRNSPEVVSAWHQYAKVLLSSSSFYYVE